MVIVGPTPLVQRLTVLHRQHHLGLIQEPLWLRVSARLAANWTHWVWEAE
jgi:hypothetical protein